jgi:hypothetical protein
MTRSVLKLPAWPGLSQSLRPWLGLLLFKLNWWLLVLGQERWQWWVAGIAIPLQIATLVNRDKQQLPPFGVVLWRCGLFAACGIAMDQVLTMLGVLVFSAPTFNAAADHIPWLPAWLLLLWLSFVLSLPHCQAWIRRLPVVVLLSLGGLAGLLSYQAGALFNAVQLGPTFVPATLVVAIAWSAVLPAWRWWWQRPRHSPPRRPLGKHPLLSLVALSMGVITAAVAIVLSVGFSSPLRAAESALLPTSGTTDAHALANAAAMPMLSLVGQASFRYLLWPIYDATLYAESAPFQFPESVPFALHLRYQRNISSTQIIEQTLKQWQQQAVTVPPGWQQQLAALIPNIATGDTLSLHVDKHYHSQLQYNGRPLGSIADRDFTLAFAGIWLAPTTSAPQLRRRLLGQP